MHRRRYPEAVQGPELSENNVLAGDRNLRMHPRRATHWEYFHDLTGSPLTRHQTPAKLRADHAAPRDRDPFYYNPSPTPRLASSATAGPPGTTLP